MAGSAIRAIARNLMPQFLQANFSSRTITNYLVENYGAAYRRTTLLADIREFAHLAKYQNQTKQYSGSELFSKNLMDERELRREAKYYVRGEVQYKDMATGEITTGYASMYTDDLESKDTWQDQFMDYQVESESDPSKVAVGFNIFSVSHYQGRPY